MAGEKLIFRPNVMEEVTLGVLSPRAIPSTKFPDKPADWLYSLADGNHTYLPPPAHHLVQELGVGPGERIQIGKVSKKVGQFNTFDWQVKRVDPPRSAPVRDAPREIAAPAASAQNGNGHNNGNHSNGNGNYATATRELASAQNAHDPIAYAEYAAFMRKHGNGNGNYATEQISRPAAPPPAPAAPPPAQLAAGEAMRRCLMVAVDSLLAARKYAADQGMDLKFREENVCSVAATLFIAHQKQGGY